MGLVNRRSIVAGVSLLLLFPTLGGVAAASEVDLGAFGAVPNVDTAQAALRNRDAIEQAFRSNRRVRVKGGRNDFYAIAGGAAIPDGCTLLGDAVVFRMRGQGIELGHRAQSLGISYAGMRDERRRRQQLPHALAPTVGANQYALIQARGKVGCRIDIPYLGEAPINGLELSNCRFCDVRIERASGFGDDGVFTPTEGSIIYAPGTTDSSLHVGDGRQSFGLGAISLLAPARLTITGKIADTRRAAVVCAVGHPPGPGVTLSNMVFERMGGIAPLVSMEPNHWQTTCAVFIPGANDPTRVKVVNCTVIGWGETLLEGCMTVENLKATTSADYDQAMDSPNPGALYGNMVVTNSTIEGYRGRGYSHGGERGQELAGIRLQGVRFLSPRPTRVYGAPSFIHIQPIGDVVADDIVIEDCVGMDPSNAVRDAIVLSGSDGGRFSRNCQVTKNRISGGAVIIDRTIVQRDNSWN